MGTDTTVNNLIINKLTKALYDAIANPSDTELYLVPDEIDNTPTLNSTNPVTSGGVYTALSGKLNTLVAGSSIKNINGLSILGSGNISISGAPLHLKILVIGNSYSYDSFMYMPFILQNYDITIKIGIYYRGGGTILNHIDEWDSNTTGRCLSYIDTGNGDVHWMVNDNLNNPHKCVIADNWDIIVLLQESLSSASVSNFSTTRTLIDMITSAYLTQFPNLTFQLGWNININRSTMGTSQTVENNILDAIKATCDTLAINIIFPYGTAVFDARTNSTLNAIGDGGKLWSDDEVHLQLGLPCYLAALANTQTLFNKFYPQFSVYGDTLRPTDALDGPGEWYWEQQSLDVGWNILGQNGNCVGVTEANCRLAQICAIVANRYPFEIKTIS